MEIEYKGATAITIKSGSSVNVVVDPKLSSVGLKDLKITDAIELVTDTDLAIDMTKDLNKWSWRIQVSGVSIKRVFQCLGLRTRMVAR